MVQMIIMDLDKTLLRSDSTISGYTVSVLRKCQAKGIKVAFATARSLQASARFFVWFTPDIFIGYGGSLAVAGDKVISRFDIPAEVSAGLINECLQEPEISVIHAINETAALANEHKNSITDSSHYQYSDFTSTRDVSYLKISVTSANPAVVERIALNYPMCGMLRYTGEDLYRFANINAVKWNAVKSVSEYYKLDTASFVAFGDDINDLDMIKNCGVGVAVKNAVYDVKAVAKDICDTNDNDGVAKWLETHVLFEV